MLQVLNSLHDLASDQRFSLTIGNFDGVHLGHQYLLKKLKYFCDRNKLQLVVMTFHPHPQEILGIASPFQYLNTREEKLQRLEQYGVNIVIEVPFNRDLSTISAKDFIENCILVHPGLKKLTLGHDFAFGANKEGNHFFVKKFWQEHASLVASIELEVEDKFELNSELISSTFIRKLLLEGNIRKANSFLAQNYELEGLVVKGDGRGRTIGFPTANMNYSVNKCLPSRGVYSTITKYKDETFISLTNIGLNPTFLDQKVLRVETHLLNFTKDIYGESIKVYFIDRIRDEIKFSNVDSLITQIANDIKYRINENKE